MPSEPRIGDIIELPVSKAEIAYCQCILDHPEYGMLYRFFDYVGHEPMDIDRLDPAALLFPPVFCTVEIPVEDGTWKIVGNRTVEDFEFPLFKWTLDAPPSEHSVWYIWDGKERKRIGRLNAKHEYLEWEQIWSHISILNRISHEKGIPGSPAGNGGGFASKLGPGTVRDSWLSDDIALDWITDLRPENVLSEIVKAFDRVISLGANDYLESPESSIALVAAELVASALGHPERTDLSKMTAMQSELDATRLPNLSECAIRVIDRIERRSELRDLWEESGELEEFMESLGNLRVRLKI